MRLEWELAPGGVIHSAIEWCVGRSTARCSEQKTLLIGALVPAMRHSRGASVVHAESVYRLHEAPQPQHTRYMDVAGQFTAYVRETTRWNKLLYTQDVKLFIFPMFSQTFCKNAQGITNYKRYLMNYYEVLNAWALIMTAHLRLSMHIHSIISKTAHLGAHKMMNAL